MQPKNMYPIQEYGPPLTLSQAKFLAQAAEVHANKNGWKMVIAVADAAGSIVLLHKMDNAQRGSVAVAQAKALTAVNFKRPSQVFEQAVAAGGLGLRILATEGICPLEGGIPVVVDGKIAGAIGISGAQSHEDGSVAEAALQAFASNGEA